MNIVIDTVGFGGSYSFDQIAEHFLIRTRDFKDNHYIIITDGNKKLNFKFANMVIEEIIPKSSITYYAWYTHQKNISALIKKHKAQIILTPLLYSKIFVKIHQVLLLPHFAEIIYPDLFTKQEQLFYKKYVDKSIRKSERIITSSVKWKEELTHRFTKNAKQVLVFQDIFPKNKKAIFSVKNKFTDDHEYFLVIDQKIDNDKLIYLLKAFSAFKKRLKSSMKILFLLNEKEEEMFATSIKSYKYREDVVCIKKTDQEGIQPFLDEAYAIIYNSLYTDFELNVLRIANSNTMLIAADSDHNEVKHLLKDAALYYNYKDIASLSAGMMQIYKDEILRSRLIALQQAYVTEQEKVEKTLPFIDLAN